MAFRRFLRGEIPAEQIDAVARRVAARYGDVEETTESSSPGSENASPSRNGEVHVEYLEADNWLSTPIVVNERWFVKVISEQHSFVHALLTTGRNLGAFTSGVEGFFEHIGTPVQMAERELAATRTMREIGVNAPAPLEAFEHEDLGVLVLEYLPDFRTLDDVSREEAVALAPELFASLATMHDAGLAHGDLRAENVLVADGELYFIDATSVREDAIADARAYDLACALASLEPLIGVSENVRAAAAVYDPEILLAAREFLDFVNLRPDHDFDAAGLKGELEKRAS